MVGLHFSASYIKNYPTKVIEDFHCTEYFLSRTIAMMRNPYHKLKKLNSEIPTESIVETGMLMSKLYYPPPPDPLK